MSNNAKALSNVSGFIRRWRNNIAVRINRRQDDLFNSLSDALKLLEARSDSNYPAVLEIDTDMNALSQGGDATTDIVVTGTNLVGDADKASGSSSDSTGQLDFIAILPGEQTITIDIDLDDNGVSADPVNGTITVSIAGTEDADAVIAEIVATDAKYMVAVTTTLGTALIDTAESVSVTNTTGEADPGTIPTMTLGSQSFNGADTGFGITAWSDTSFTFDLDQRTLTAGATYMLRLWVDDVLAFEMPVNIAA